MKITMFASDRERIRVAIRLLELISEELSDIDNIISPLCHLQLAKEQLVSIDSQAVSYQFPPGSEGP